MCLQCLAQLDLRGFSTWSGIISAIALLKDKADSYHKKENKNSRTNIEFQQEAKVFVLKKVQQEAFTKEIQCLNENKPLPKDSSMFNLSPILDNDGLLKVGGRLVNAEHLNTGEKHLVIIPAKCHIATLLVRHYHEQVKHQGRHLTEGAVRSAGYWITGGKRLISSMLCHCVKCKKLRGKLEQQKMADLPRDRLTPSPPFTYVGVDTFGPWPVVTRRTRGGQANSKRWAVMFSCLTTRGIHIEVIEELSSSSFINALRRFVSLRGPVKEFRSDRGTNFMGSTDDLGIRAVHVEDGEITNFLNKHETIWKLNPPHASHMGGCWERMIGLSRRILDAMLCDVNAKQLTHEVLCTLMAEVCAIINGRPITSVSNDPDAPTVLSPSMLITQKVNADIEPFEHLNIKDMFKCQWRHVQVMANRFWQEWSSQYIQSLQSRNKWQQESRNLKPGDIVLMKDQESHRNNWPLGIVKKVFPSSDGGVRKTSVCVMKGGQRITYTRPITQLVLLFSTS
ncbi:Uncharacterised protein r2_g3176 [Pycnogonum litorale]